MEQQKLCEAVQNGVTVASRNFVSVALRHMLAISLVVQWLRLCASNAGAWVPTLVRELDPHAATKSFHMRPLRPGSVK